MLFATQPADGHLYPLLPVAEAARSVGHDVAIASSALFEPAYRENARRLRDVAASLPPVDFAVTLIENAVSAGLGSGGATGGPGRGNHEAPERGPGPPAVG
jgi:hypothetical protein